MSRLFSKFIFTIVLFAAPLNGAEAQVGELPPLQVDQAKGIVFLENHGRFRVRTSLFSQPGIKDANAPLISPSSADGSEYDSTTFGSDLRFRYEPKLHISDNFALNITADFLKDLNMGGSPQSSSDGQPSGAEQDSYANYDTQADQIFITRLYGSWEPVSGFQMRLGRMPAHFGLGMEENNGDCDDCNGGTVVDGFDAKANALGSNIRIAWRWPAEGANSGNTSMQSGQAYDLSDIDDASEWLFEFTPESTGDFAEREKLAEARKNHTWLFDWAARLKWRSGGLQSDRFPKGVPCEGSAPGPDTPYDCMSLIPRDLSLWTPGFFLQLKGWPGMDKYVELNLEVHAKLGSIGNVLDTTPEPNSKEEISTSREIQALGAAFEGSYTDKAWTYTLKSGLATGDSEGSFLGVKDGSNTLAPAGISQSELESYQNNQTFEQFIFHRDFFADVLLFREIVGAITNTAYVRPSVAYRFDRGDHSYTIESGVMSAWALAPEATPGKRGDFGIEGDVKLKYATTENLNIIWTVAGLKPGEALAPGEDANAPSALYSTQLDLFIRF